MAETVAIVLSALWLFSAAAFFVFLDATGTSFDPLRFVVTLLAIFLPVGLIWVATEAARSARTMREETARLETAIDALRQAYLASQGAQRDQTQIEQRLDEIVDVARKAETAIATFTSIRTPPPPPPVAPTPAAVFAAADQPSLALGTPPEATGTPVGTEDLVAAFQFPATAEDR